MEELVKKIKDFSVKRNWRKYHTPKNLAISIVSEACELLEIFMWLSDAESLSINDDQKLLIEDEIGDITIQLMNFCNILEIDPIQCAYQKIEKNEIKYPVEKSFGSAKKYNKL